MTQTEGNPLLEKHALPPFDKIETKHIIPAVRQSLKTSQEKLRTCENKCQANIASSCDWQIIEDLNEIEVDLHNVWGPLMHLLGVKNNPELRKAQESVQKEFISFCLEMEQSEVIYQSIQKIEKNLIKDLEQNNSTQSSQSETLDTLNAKLRIISLRLKGARQNGVGLVGNEKKRFNEIAKELSRLSTKFANNVLDATKAFYLDLKDKKDIAGLPPSMLRLAAHQYQQAHSKPNATSNESSDENSDESSIEEKGPWRITLDTPSFLPFMQHAENRELRKKLYLAYISRASTDKTNNMPIIQKILRLREEQAGILGFSHYAEMRMNTRMAKNVDEVYQLIEQLRKVAWDMAQSELKEVEAMAIEKGHSEKLAHWDLAYYAERLREQRFDFTEEDLRPYFPLAKVLEGLFNLANELFDINIVSADGDCPVWHPDVRYFRVLDENKKQLASFYLDPYSRPEEKRGGAWMDECKNRRKTKDGLELPVAYLICNAAPPVQDKPSLMNFREVETLFHEFGHGLQHMLTKIEHPDISGINGVEWDAVELPSQFMENWCYFRPCLRSLSSHIDTKEAISDTLFEKITANRNFQAASILLRQLRFSLIDMELHHKLKTSATSNTEKQIEEIVTEINKKTMLFPALAEDKFLCSFSHIFGGGYAAGYYSYKWAEVLSADAFSAFEEAGLDNLHNRKKLGLAFRNTILGLGGSQSPELIFCSFRGRKANIEALLRHNGLAS